MLTIVLTWATLLWALAAAGALFVALTFVASIHIAVDFARERHEAERKFSDWRFVCRHWRPWARPVGYVVVKLCHIRASSLVGRLVLEVYKWTR